MKQLFKKFETMAMAVAFAEEGCWDTAREIMNSDQKNKKEVKQKESTSKKRQPRMHV